jgi:hypothetical protein
MLYFFLFLSNLRIIPLTGHNFSCAELHFWCKYRHISEILQTFSSFFYNKQQNNAIFRAIHRKNSVFSAKFRLYIGVCTHLTVIVSVS